MQLERVARDTILQNIKEALVNKTSILRRLRTFTNDTGLAPNLTAFLGTYESVTPEDIYRTGRTFASLVAEAGLTESYLCRDE